MRYCGGKFRIAKSLTNFLKYVRKQNQVFVDGMVGGGSIIRFIDGNRIANDKCPYLIEFYKAIQNGWRPKENLSEQDYKRLQKLYKDGVCNGEIGFGLYFCSWGGKFNGGYARNSKFDKSFKLVNGQLKDCYKLSDSINDVKFICSDYEDLLKYHLKVFQDIKSRCLIYFDIPYFGTTEYRFKFDHIRFWEVIREYSTIHDIYISEYVAPEDFECVWSMERKTNLNTKDACKSDRIEKLFKYMG